MSIDDSSTRYTGEYKRSSSDALSRTWHPGPYVAIVESHLDSTYMGRLKVQILSKKQNANDPNNAGEFYTVNYLSPFYGATPYAGVSNQEGDQYSQKSYGMWFVPPDIGSKVLVIFAEGGEGFWIGCIPEQGMNIMVPAVNPATTYNSSSTEDKLPVGEYNKKIAQAGAVKDTTKFIKPVFSDALETLQTQGLDKDETRGLTSSSARRELPSSVFGISTPGPYDKRENAPTVNYGRVQDNLRVYHNRLGGSSLVFDDGDATFLRKGPASESPSDYVDLNQNETGGDKTIPHNEMLRLKTRTGHQILMHNSEDLIYIGNSKGTAWVELTSNGKIDIYSQDSISVRTGQDFNFKADRDINFQADRDFNVKAKKNITFEAENENFQLVVGKDSKITTSGQLDISTEGNNIFTSNANTEIKTAQDHIESTGGKIKMNGPEATEAEKATALQTWTVSQGETDTIMRRVPSKEPWLSHENLSPLNFTPVETDIKKLEERRGQGITPFPPNEGEYKFTADTFRRGR